MGRSFFKGKRAFWLIAISGLLLAVILSVYGIQGVKAAIAWLYAVDDGGADDQPGQKDLNFLETGIDIDVPGELYVNWGLDNTDWSGNNSGDVCVLFDNDDNGFADYSFCVTVQGAPAAITVQQLYSCGDAAPDKCTNPIVPIAFTSDAGADPGTGNLIAPIDPFGNTPDNPLTKDIIEDILNPNPYYDPDHVVGNTCSYNTGVLPTEICYTNDTYVWATFTELDLFNMGNPEMINVCSYPSSEPNSAPSDCVFLAGAGFLEIVKVADPDIAEDFTFNLGAGQESAGGISSWTITGSGSTSTQGYFSFEPGSDYDLSEIVPSGWSLTDATCLIEGSTTPTGTWSGTTVTDFSIQTGLTTTCTFTNNAPVDVTVTKTDYDYARTAPYPLYPYRGSLLPYTITVTNKDMALDLPAENVVVTDSLDTNVIVADPFVYTINLPNDNNSIPRTCTYNSIDHEIVCDLGTMAPLEVVTIDFHVTVGPLAPIGSGIEYGECTQDPNLQGTSTVDVCNIVSVSADNEAASLLGDNTDSEPTDLGKPTAITLLNFTATGEEGAIRLDWETGMETQNLGFNIYRAVSLHAPKTKINDELILGSPGGTGATYTYTDEVKARNTFYYWIEDVDIYNNTVLHEDMVASARALKKIK